MDSQLSEALDRLTDLRQRIGQCDWPSLDRLSASLPRETLRPGQDGLGEYLDGLRETLALARASRARSVTSLGRIQVAARFNEGRGDFAHRQNSAGASDL